MRMSQNKRRVISTLRKEVPLESLPKELKELALMRVEATGEITCLYTEKIDLNKFGKLDISRASHVEPTPDGQWTADCTPVGGVILGPFPTHSEAIAAEVRYVNQLIADGKIPQ